MQEQNYQNHRKLDPVFHIVLLAIIIYLIVQSIINLVGAFSNNNNKAQAVMFFFIAIALAISYIKIRTFPIKAQDRAIRAEENLRYFTLTGKLLDKNLKISQIIALRFAPDHENGRPGRSRSKRKPEQRSNKKSNTKLEARPSSGLILFKSGNIFIIYLSGVMYFIIAIISSSPKGDSAC
jgi:hypothetical protein